MNIRNITTLSIITVLVFFSTIIAQQNLPFLRVSPQAEVSQNVGFAEIEINYGRPGVKGREIWGNLVPYGLAPNPFGNGKPMPWRGGANENTTINFSHDVEIEGNSLPAGTYSLHMLVYEDEWTIIFNKSFRGWGSFFHEESDDVLKIKVKPVSNQFEEWLNYGFDKLTASSCDVFMKWGDLKVSFAVNFDQHKIVLDTYRNELKGLAGFNNAAWAAAARYSLQNKVNLKEAMEWIDKALGMNNGNSFANKVIKSNLLKEEGKLKEADEIIESSFDDATEAEINVYGYQLIGENRYDDALKVFKLNVKKFPESWNVYDSLGEIQNLMGDNENSIINYENAYDLAPDAQKSRIEGILRTL